MVLCVDCTYEMQVKTVDGLHQAERKEFGSNLTVDACFYDGTETRRQREVYSKLGDDIYN